MKAKPELAPTSTDMKAKPELAPASSDVRPQRSGGAHAAERRGHRSAFVLTPLVGVAVAGAIIGAMALVPGHSTDRAGADALSQHAPAATTAQNRPAYAGDTITAYLTGYANHVLQFRPARWVVGGLDGGHFAVAKQSYSLRVAATPRIRSAVALCSGGQLTMDRRTGAPTKSCTSAQMAVGLSTGTGAYADLSIDLSGRITTVSERYVP